MTQNKKANRYPLEDSPLYKIRRQKDLLRILQIQKGDLALVMSQSLYFDGVVEERGKIRQTETPIRILRRVHDRLTKLLMRIEPPIFLYCPVKGRSQIDNARAHRGSSVVRTLDVKAYFPSTPASKVNWFFRKSMECSEDVSAILTKVITRNERLPTGSPVSPIMAFYAFSEMWHEVARIAANANCIVTIWMDDLTISGLDVPGDMMWNIRKAIHNAGLKYHKERVYRREPAKVTGIILNKERLLLPYRQHESAHTTRELLRATTDDQELVKLENRLKGLSGYRDLVRRVDNLAS